MTMTEELVRVQPLFMIGMAVRGRLWAHKSMGQALMITLGGQFLLTIQEIKLLRELLVRMKLPQMRVKQEFMNSLMVAGYSLDPTSMVNPVQITLVIVQL